MLGKINKGFGFGEVDPKPLAKRVADLLKEQGYSRLEDVDHRIFQGAIWVQMRNYDHASLTTYHDKIEEYPIYPYVKEFIECE